MIGPWSFTCTGKPFQTSALNTIESFRHNRFVVVGLTIIKNTFIHGFDNIRAQLGTML